MGAENDIEIFGRKIFFLNPAYSIRNAVFKELEKQEFEVYLIDSFHDAKNLLRRNPYSLLFVNVDAQLSMNAWYNFIRSFEEEDSLKTTYITILSERIKQNDRLLFESTKEVTGGFITMGRDVEDIIADIMKVLKDTNAKGKRQYVRASLETDEEASFFWNNGAKMHQLQLLDLSTVGMSVRVSNSIAPDVTKNTLLREITLRLGTKQLVAGAVVFGVKKEEESSIWILLLLPSTPVQVKEAIRNYVYLRIQQLAIKSIEKDIKDDIDYNRLGYYSLESKSKTDSMDSEPAASQPAANAVSKTPAAETQNESPSPAEGNS